MLLKKVEGLERSLQPVPQPQDLLKNLEMMIHQLIYQTRINKRIC